MDAVAIEELKKALEPLFSKLGQGLDAGWALLIKMAYVHVVELAGITIGMLLVAIAWAIVLKKMHKKVEEEMERNKKAYENEESWQIAYCVVSGFGILYGAIFVIQTISNSVEIAKILYMPEVWAFQHILSLVK